MKALLLVYIGKDVQGLQLAKEVVAGRPTDLSTLGNLDKVFVIANDCTPYNLAGIKNLDKTSVSMFEDAFKVSPLEDIGALWFFSVLRTQDMKSLFSVIQKRLWLLIVRIGCS